MSISFYLQTEIIIDPQLGCFSSPVMTAPAIFTAVKEQPVNFSFAVNNPDNIVLNYSLTTPLMLVSPERPVAVPYTLPENASINQFNGLFNWDTKYLGQYREGEYVFTIKITMWKKQEDGTHLYLGHTTFDTQVNVVDSEGTHAAPPELDTDKEGWKWTDSYSTDESVTIKIILPSNVGSGVELTAYSELSANPEAYAFTTYDSTSVSGRPIKVGLLMLNSTVSIDREAPYIISVRNWNASERSKGFEPHVLHTRDISPEPVVTAVKDELVFEVYPNPTSDKVFINYSINTPSIIHLTNAKEKGLECNQTPV